MNYQHQNLAEDGWAKLTVVEQLANVGSEVERTISWKKKNNLEYSRLALERALELLGFSISLPQNRKRLKELTRLRELLIDYFLCQNQYQSSDVLWQKYFYAFAYAARVNH
ncbi:MAG: hypothetical protein ABID04_02295 [Patescibacteria group bacterium]